MHCWRPSCRCEHHRPKEDCRRPASRLCQAPALLCQQHLPGTFPAQHLGPWQPLCQPRCTGPGPAASNPSLLDSRTVPLAAGHWGLWKVSFPQCPTPQGLPGPDGLAGPPATSIAVCFPQASPRGHPGWDSCRCPASSPSPAEPGRDRLELPGLPAAGPEACRSLP